MNYPAANCLQREAADQQEIDRHAGLAYVLFEQR
jgi:hypothetical protein